VEVILRKRDGLALSEGEISEFVLGYCRGEVADEQAAAFCMAVFFRGMTPEETAALTGAMVASGGRVDLSSVPGPRVDKHSTGGVGDKTTLVLAPLMAAAGLRVAKLAGRGLGHTGGTLDKLESIPGLRVDLSRGTFLDQLRRIGVAVAGQTDDLVPADRRLYALRDVTGTVDSLPLVAASVMSKKLAGGADAVALDVKVGRGAFAATRSAAEELAALMRGIGERSGLRVATLLSAMDQPLGHAVGNALEVREAVEALHGRGPDDLIELCLALGERLLALAGVRADLELLLRRGAALARFRDLVAAQGGDPRVADDPDAVLPRAARVEPVPSPGDGYVLAVDALLAGRAAADLGAGRRRKEDAVDPAAGLVLRSKVGDRVRRGEPLAWVHGREVGQAVAAVLQAYRIGPDRPARPRLLL
jgi:pyrimidine-nucleoside phosphorylase